MAGSGAVLGWLGTLWVLLSAPAAAVPQLNVCKNTLALSTAGFGLCMRGVRARDPQIPLWEIPLQGWSPVLSGRWKQRGCRQGCSGQVTLWDLWPGKKNCF